MKPRIFLVGLRGSGKTSVARKVADQLNWGCLDTDQWVQEQSGMTIRQIFETAGESSFRDWETPAVDACTRMDRCVVSMGGGVVLRPIHRQWLVERGHSVWLQAAPEVLAGRIQADQRSAAQRPSLTGLSLQDEISELMASREAFYREVSVLAIKTDGRTPDEVAEEIVLWWRDHS
jgi:shikimate kinase